MDLLKVDNNLQNSTQGYGEAMSCVEEGGQKTNNGLKVNDMMDEQAGNKLAHLEDSSSLKQIRNCVRFQEKETYWESAFSN